jgi:hypothetical protein
MHRIFFNHAHLLSSLQPFDMLLVGCSIRAQRFAHCRVSTPTWKDWEVSDWPTMPDARRILLSKQHSSHVIKVLHVRAGCYPLPIVVREDILPGFIHISEL